MPVIEIITACNVALEKLTAASKDLKNAEEAWGKAFTALQNALIGSHQSILLQEIQQVGVEITAKFLQVRGLLTTITIDITTYRDRLRGRGIGGPRPPTTNAPTPPAVSSPLQVRSPAGDRYPPEAAGLAELIDQPYSPVNSGIPVVGLIQPPKHPVHEFTPGGGHWTDRVQQRLDQLNAPDWVKKVDYHVEMQAAAWLMDSGANEATLVINREPCGEQFGKGCHQALQGFLRSGFRLTVVGTRGGEQYYKYYYEGKSPR